MGCTNYKTSLGHVWKTTRTRRRSSPHAALQGSAGYRVLYIWGSDWKRAKKGSIPLNEALCDDL